MLVSTVTGCVLIYAFPSYVWVPVGITSSIIEIKISVITAGKKNYKAVIKNKKKTLIKKVLLGKDKLGIIKILISKSLIYSHISHDEFVSNNVLREYNKIKEEMYYIKTIETFCVTCKKNTANKNSIARKLNKKYWCFYQTVLFGERKNQLLLRKKNSAILIIFKLISVKWKKIINKILLNGGKFLLKLYLKQPKLTYNVCGTFTKHHERIQKFKEISNLKHLYRNELDKAYFAHVTGYPQS